MNRLSAFLPLLVALLLPWPAASQPTRPLTARDSSVTLSAKQARIIDADLQRLPLVLRENYYLRVAGNACAGEATQLRATLTAKDTVIVAQGRRIGGLQVLEQDANTRAAGWHLKAKSRWWVIVGETALLLGITTLAITK